MNASRGQKAAYLQSQYTQQAIRSQLIGGIANAYFTLLMLDRQVEITSKTVDIYKENVRAMEAMKVAGMTTEAAVVQMRAVYHQVSGSLIELKRQVREVENSLSVLLAKAPQPIDRSTLEDQVMPEELMAGVPLQLLENRPDVKVAEMTLAALIIRLIRPVLLFIRESILRRQRLDEWFGCYGFNPGQFMFQALASLAQLSLTMVSWWPTEFQKRKNRLPR